MKYFVATLIILMASAALAQPDLQVYNLEYSQATGRLVATIYNQAQDPVNDKILVDFYDNGKFYGAYEYLNGLSRYSTVSVYLNYNLDANNHTIKAVVDPNDVVYESKEVNNERTIFLEGKKLDMTPVLISTVPSAIELPKVEYNSVLSYFIVLIILIVLVFAYAKILRKKRIHEEKPKKKKEETKTFFDK
jgi:subtilase family serine protease